MSARDFRVQMRGTKALWVFTVYVFVLGIVGIGMYASIIAQGYVTMAGAQSQLYQFFMITMVVMGAAICLISPGLTATAIVSEKQRLSLDLVMSAPLEPKYVLVGKMISGYRYTWMLLILALPIVAVSVILGGATWSDVFGDFVLLSFQALIFTSLALMISTMTNKAASAMVWSLMAVFAYVLVVSYVSALGAAAPALMGSTAHLPFTVGLSPFLVTQAVGTTTSILGHDVPNWLLDGVFSLLVARLFLLGAAVTLAPMDKRLSANLRISSLVYMFLSAWLITAAAFGLAPAVGVHSIWTPRALIASCIVPIAWLVLAMPILSCFGTDGSRRFFPNGFFRIRSLLDGSPAGGLPFVLALVGASVAGSAVGAWSLWNFSAELWGGVLWLVGLVTFLWSIGRWISSRAKVLRTARSLTLATILLTLAIVPMTMGILQYMPAWEADTDSKSSLWYVWPFAPLGGDGPFNLAAYYGLAFLALAALLAFDSQRGLTRSKDIA